MTKPRFITEEEMHGLLLQAYHQVPEENFLFWFSQALVDPAASVSEKRMRNCHPVLLIVLILSLATVVLLAFLAWSKL